MKIDQMTKVLDRYADVLKDNKDPATHRALKEFAAALRPHKTKTVKSFVKETKKRQSLE